MKLHIGCGNRYFEGWTNLDIAGKKADVFDDASKLNLIPNNSCDIIYAAHVLEHFGRKEVSAVLKVWYKKLKPKGILRLSVPDFEKVILMYKNSYKLQTLLGFLVGGQRDQYDLHKMVFDAPCLTDLLTKVGFKKIRNWDWHKTEHSQYDDYSQAYLPHMEKNTGTMMSLNIEAIK